jgi:vesicle-associated membrane protein 7
MTIIHSLVAREAIVLAEHASTSGNFASISSQILAKLPPQDTRMSYAYDRYLFHYVKKNGLVFMCMADEGFGRRIPFAFLEDISTRFNALYGQRAQTAMAFGLSEFHSVLQQQMVRAFIKHLSSIHLYRLINRNSTRHQSPLISSSKFKVKSNRSETS